MSDEPKAESRTVDSVVGKRKFHVWFSQVNQTFFEVEAENEMDAQLKATMMWRDENHTPHMCDIEELSNAPLEHRPASGRSAPSGCSQDGG